MTLQDDLLQRRLFRICIQSHPCYSLCMNFFKTSLAAGIPFGIAMAVIFSLRFGPYLGISAGAFSGITFGLALAAFQRTHSGVVHEDAATFETPANHYCKGEYRGGGLFSRTRVSHLPLTATISETTTLKSRSPRLPASGQCGRCICFRMASSCFFRMGAGNALWFRDAVIGSQS
jgi:hypothetical protein